MNTKAQSSTIKQLRNWFVIDQLLFENDAKKAITSGTLFKEYLSLKTSFLSNLSELYQHLNLKFAEKEKPKDDKVLHEQAMDIVKKSKSLATALIAKDGMKKIITEQVRLQTKKIANGDVNKISDIIVESKFKSISMDNAFIGMPMMENKIELMPDDFKTQIYYEAYRLQRNGLIELAAKAK